MAMIDVLNAERPKRVVIVASNPGVSEQTGWPIGFWWSELTHPYWELTERGYHVDVASPGGGKLEADSWSDPRDDSQYSADDLISLGFINSPEHLKLVEESMPIAEIAADEYDAALFVGGQAPMYTWGTIFPLITLVVLALDPVLTGLALVPRLAVTTAVTVPLMTWVVMPRVTRAVGGWLYPK